MHRENDFLREPFCDYLRGNDWYVQIMNSNALVDGQPDIWATHKSHGVRFIEFKIIDFRYSTITFRPAQLLKFPIMYAHGAPLYIICLKEGIDLSKKENLSHKERLYKKLFEPSNAYWIDLKRYSKLY